MKTPEDSLLSMEAAASRGIGRLRRAEWAHPMDHIEIPILGGRLGALVKLWFPFNMECNGRDPVLLFIGHFDTEAAEWVPYDGPLPDSQDYQDAREVFDGVLGKDVGSP